MEKTWVMVRITRDTHAALCRIRESMELAEEMQLVQLTRDHTSHVSLNQVIERLIAARDKHAERRQRSNARRRKPAATSADPEPADVADAPAVAADPPADFS